MKKTPLALLIGGLLSGVMLTGCNSTDESAPEPVAKAAYELRDNRDEVFYFVMPDRFNNGDDTNDFGGAGTAEQGGFNPTDKGYYHGGDIEGLRQKLPYLDGMGVTAIWMTPMFKNQAVQGDSAAYHGYWITDFTQVDPHFGTNYELKQFIDEAHARDIRVFFDVIVNHTADVIKYDECHEADGSHKPEVDYTCAFRSAEESAENPYTPFIPAGKEDLKVPAWLNDTENYHNQGDSTFAGESSVKGDFFGLDDLATSKQEVKEGFVELAKGWIDEFGIDGFRIDTVKHVDLDFWQYWSPRVMEYAKEKGIDNFFMFGEVYSGDPQVLSTYTTKGKLPSVLDFGIQAAVGAVFGGNQGTSALAELFAQDDRYTSGDSDASLLMNFAGNHDMGRFGHFITRDNPDASDEELQARMKLANAFLYFARGIPVIYYGDEQGFAGDGGDKDARENMFASRVESFNDNNLIGTDLTTADRNFDTLHPLYQSFREFAQIYQAESGLRRGVQHVRFSEDKPGLFALSRIEVDGPEYLVVFNSSDRPASLMLEASADGYEPLYAKSGADLEVFEDFGQLSVTVPAMDFVIYKASEAPAAPAAVPSITVSGVEEGYRVAGELNISLDTSGEVQPLAPYQASFYASFDGGERQLLGVDKSAPYQLFWDTSEIADGTQVMLSAELSYGQDSSTAESSFYIDSRVPSMEITYANDKKPQFAYTVGANGFIDGPLVLDAEGKVTLPWNPANNSATLVFGSLNDAGQLELHQPIGYTRAEIVNHNDRVDAIVPLTIDTTSVLDGTGYGSIEPLADALNVRGGVNDWGATPMTYLGNGTYHATLNVTKGDNEFKFADAEWASINIGGPVSATGLERGANPSNLKHTFAEAGDYDFYLQVVDVDGEMKYFHFVQPTPAVEQ